MSASCLYAGKVVHVRHRPVTHRLDYSVFMGLFDLDELPQLDRRSWLFGYNRPALVSFKDSDHGDGTGAPLRPQIEQALLDADIVPPGGPIRLLCMPRLLGYLFNPLSVYFCHKPDGSLGAVVHEVNNTFGGRHFYALPALVGRDGRVRQHTAKDFKVSPLLPMDLDYQFQIEPPGAATRIHIGVQRQGAPVLTAWFAGQRETFSTMSLLRLTLTHPGMTLKVMAAIHWEAALTWLKLRRDKARQGRTSARQGA